MGEPHEDYPKKNYDLIGMEASTLQSSQKDRGSTTPFVDADIKHDVTAVPYSKETSNLIDNHSSVTVPISHSRGQEFAGGNNESVDEDEDMSQYDVTELLVG